MKLVIYSRTAKKLDYFYLMSMAGIRPTLCCLRIKDDRTKCIGPVGPTGPVCLVFRMNCFARFVSFSLVFDFVTHRERKFIEGNSGSEPLNLFQNSPFALCIYCVSTLACCCCQYDWQNCRPFL
jgi:hypothetical protein